VESAAAASGVAVAELFPRIVLTGQDASLHLVPTSLDAISARYWTLGPSVHWPILDIGRLLGNIRVQRARHEQALRTYEESVLAAIKDVEDAVVAYREGLNRRDKLNQAAINYEDALNSAQELYKAGVEDYHYVLEAQQMYLSAKEGKNAADTSVALSLTRLYKALGGSWIDKTNVESTVQGSSHAE
jgi:outer membrane protein TolC